MLAVYFIAFVWTRSHASWQDFSSAVLSITKDCFLKKGFYHYLYLLLKVFCLGRMKHTTFLRRELRFGLVTQRGGALRDETKRLRGRRRQTLHSSTEHLSQNTP